MSPYSRIYSYVFLCNRSLHEHVNHEYIFMLIMPLSCKNFVPARTCTPRGKLNIFPRWWSPIPTMWYMNFLIFSVPTLSSLPIIIILLFMLLPFLIFILFMCYFVTFIFSFPYVCLREFLCIGSQIYKKHPRIRVKIVYWMVDVGICGFRIVVLFNSSVCIQCNH